MLMIGTFPKDFQFRSNIDYAKKDGGSMRFTNLGLLTLWSWAAGPVILVLKQFVKKAN